MYSMKFVRFIAVFFSLLLFGMGSDASAEPVAPLSKYSKEGMKLIAQQNKTLKDLEKEIPSQAQVGIPVYPGATFASTVGSEDGDLPPTVNLIANDPPGKVKEWYRQNLSGWNYSEKLDLFYDGQTEPTFKDLFAGKYQTVGVMEEDGKGLDLMFLDIPEVKSRIQIVYKPKK